MTVHPDRAQWTQDEKQKMADLWNEGLSAGQIATIFKVARNSVIGVKTRNRHLFTKDHGGAGYRRPDGTVGRKAKPKVDKPKFIKVHKPRPAKPIIEDFGFAEPIGNRGNLSQYRCEGVEPVKFIDLREYRFQGVNQCRFFLSDFDEKATHQTLACGADTLPGKSFCPAHMSITNPSRAGTISERNAVRDAKLRAGL